MTYTSIEQSKALMRLGLDEKTADLTIIPNSAIPYTHIKEWKRGSKEYPCWSAEVLLEILPSEVYIEEEDDMAYLKIVKEDCTYTVSYYSKERLDNVLFLCYIDAYVDSKWTCRKQKTP